MTVPSADATVAVATRTGAEALTTPAWPPAGEGKRRRVGPCGRPVAAGLSTAKSNQEPPGGSAIVVVGHPGGLHQGGEAVLQERATARYQLLTCCTQLQVAPVATGAIGPGIQQPGIDQHPGHPAHGGLGHTHPPGQVRLRGPAHLADCVEGQEPPVRHVPLGLEDAIGRSIETGGQSMQTAAQITIHSITTAG